MSIIATCGHEISGTKGYSIEQYDQDRDGTPCTSYPVLCKKCYRKYKRWGLVKRLIDIEDWR